MSSTIELWREFYRASTAVDLPTALKEFEAHDEKARDRFAGIIVQNTLKVSDFKNALAWVQKRNDLLGLVFR